jgi:hypothetical protein
MMSIRFLAFALVLLVFGIATGCSSPQNNGRDTILPRIAIAGIAIESSTFSPAVTHEDAFNARYGEDVFTYYPFLDTGSELRSRAKWMRPCAAMPCRAAL